MDTISSSLRHSILLVCLLLALSSCCALPADFASLPLEQEVRVYSDLLNRCGRPRLAARSWISWHGWAAADLMAEYLDGAKSGFPDFEAVEIIDLVQMRGCPLRG